MICCSASTTVACTAIASAVMNESAAPSTRASINRPAATSIVTGGVNSSRPPLVRYTDSGGFGLQPRVRRVIDAHAQRFGNPHALVHERLPTYRCREKQPATDGNGEQDHDPCRDEGRVSHHLSHCGPRVHQHTRHATHQEFLC